MRVYIGADHRGYELKERLERYLRERGYDVADMGDDALNPDDDFPEFAGRVVSAMKADGEHARGILLCGSGQGMMIAANRHKGIRAALGWSKKAAIDSRNDEDSNVLALPADLFADGDSWQDIVESWLRTPFASAARFKRRLHQLDENS